MAFIDQFHLIECTHLLEASMPSWNGSCGFKQELRMDYPQGCRVYSYKMHAGIGTHMDAPSHFIPDSKNIADIPLEALIVPIRLIDVSRNANADFFISVQDLEIHEEMYGLIPEKSLVLGYTGWSRFWGEPDKYRNPDSETGKMHFPGFSAAAAEVLVKRKVVGIGIDTLSPDGSHPRYPVHEIILGAGGYILENMANLEKLPARGAFMIVFPIHVKEGTEAPVRAVALLSRNSH